MRPTDAELARDIALGLPPDLLARANELDAAERAQWAALSGAIANLSAKLDHAHVLLTENGKKLDKILGSLWITTE